MKSRFKTIMETRKYRFKRRRKDLLREVSKALGLIIAVLTITAAMIQGCYSVIHLPYFQIKETVVKGCTELTEKDVLTLAAIKYPQSLFAINTDAIVKRISSSPWIKSVYIGRELPNRLVIDIREKMAIALVKKDSVFYLIDTDGTPFKKIQNGDDTDLPVLNGCYTEGKMQGRLLTKSLELLKVLSNLKELPAVSHVSEINGHEMLGLSLFTDSGLCLHLGFDNYENKLKRLAPVMDDLGRRNLKPGFLLIDLSDPAKITVQQKNIFGPAAPERSNKELRT
jgi:cell division protein FtsQ